MYFGKHVKINETDYVLLLVGVRGGKFLPDLGYRISKDFVDKVCSLIVNFSEKIKSTTTTNEKENHETPITKEKTSMNHKNIIINGDNCPIVINDRSEGTIHQDNKVGNKRYKNDLSKAVNEIQILLNKLSVSNPSATNEEMIAHVNKNITPTIRKRAFGALKSGGKAAFTEVIGTIGDSYKNITKKIFEGWENP